MSKNHGKLPRRRADNGWSMILVGVLAIAGFCACTILVLRGVAHFSQRIILSLAYGEQRYSAGLRIVNKHMGLSDGTTLSGPLTFLFIGTQFLVDILMIGIVYLLGLWFLNGRYMPGVEQVNRARTSRFSEVTCGVENVFRVECVVPASFEGRDPHAYIYGRVERGTVRAGQNVSLHSKDGKIVQVRAFALTEVDRSVAEASAGPRPIALVVRGHWTASEDGRVLSVS